MKALGHERFMVAGHDRGGRVAYRLALDHPERVSRLAVLDIVPTLAMWEGLSPASAMKTYHWLFLAQPEPLPERLIAGAPGFYLEWTLQSWTKARSLAAFAPPALEAYRVLFRDPARVHALCEDYRAGATLDWQADAEDLRAGRRIACPVLALWGAAGIPSEAEGGPLAAWRRFADEVSGEAVDAGHFLMEENPEATLKPLAAFLAG